MKISNFAYELAELRIEQERDAGISRIRSALTGRGEIFCRGCDSEIDEDRRKALPSATRCLECQQRLERFKSRRRN